MINTIYPYLEKYQPTQLLQCLEQGTVTEYEVIGALVSKLRRAKWKKNYKLKLTKLKEN